MAIPIREADVRAALLPWTSSLFLSSGDIAKGACQILGEYAPYKQELSDVYKRLDSFLLTSINRMTGGSMRVITDDYATKRITLQTLGCMTDDLMGILFDSLGVFSANFMRINDYALNNESLAALRVLYQKYAAFMTAEEHAFIVQMIKRVYPRERYEAWLKA